MPFYSQECIIKEIIMNIKMLKAAFAGLILSVSGFANAGLIDVDFNGTIDGSGASIGGVASPLNSAFTLSLSLDDTLAPAGTYGVSSISFKTSVGTYDTISTWGSLQSTQNGGLISLLYNFEVNATGEHFLMNLNSLTNASFDNIQSWNNTTFSGDIIVRGVDNAANHLSGIHPYGNTLTASVPEPSTLAIFALGVMGLAARRFKKK